MVNKEEKAQSTDKADRILTHPIFGIPIFLGIMALVFLLTFTVGDFISGYFELAVEWLSGFISNALATWRVNPAVTSLLVDGIIAGVGGILTFLPNIFILFLALAFWKIADTWQEWLMLWTALWGGLGYPAVPLFR